MIRPPATISLTYSRHSIGVVVHSTGNSSFTYFIVNIREVPDEFVERWGDYFDCITTIDKIILLYFSFFFKNIGFMGTCD